MHSAAFLQDLAVVMLVAGFVTVLFRRFHQPVVLGYIFAGLIIGPHLLPVPLVTSQESIHTLAELGIIFLLFALGLEFNFRKIRKIGLTAFIVAPLETTLMFLLGYQIGQWFGWGTTDCVYLGAIMMISSTTIITKTLADQRKTGAEFAGIIFGILIAEDIIAILLIASLSGAGAGGGFDLGGVGEILMRMSIFLVTAIVVGLLVVPRLLRYIGRFRNDETLLIASLGLLFGMSMLAVKLDFSVALGAFIIGALIAESDEIHKIERVVSPLKDMFSAVFFVAIGLLIDPELLGEYVVPIIVIAVAVAIGKFVACSFGCFVAGYDRRVAMRAGFGLSQIGEFSFIIAAVGVSLGVTKDFLYPIAVAVSALTSILTPYLIRHSDALIDIYDRYAPRQLLSYQNDYTAWVRQFSLGRASSIPAKLLRTMLFQILINVALISAVFLGAAFLTRTEIEWMDNIPAWLGGEKTVMWIVAIVICLPIMIAALRKLQAMSMMISELTVRSSAGVRQRLAVRAMVSNTILFTGLVVLGLLVLLLSSTLLPPIKLLVVLGLIVLAVAILLKTFFVRIYSRAQVAIRETLAREAVPHHEHKAKAIPGLPDDVELESVFLNEHSPARGKSVRDTKLRELTGASIVAVKRGEHSTVNPTPGMELKAGDELLILGGLLQIEAARKLLE